MTNHFPGIRSIIIDAIKNGDFTTTHEVYWVGAWTARRRLRVTITLPKLKHPLFIEARPEFNETEKMPSIYPLDIWYMEEVPFLWFFSDRKRVDIPENLLLTADEIKAYIDPIIKKIYNSVKAESVKKLYDENRALDAKISADILKQMGKRDERAIED